jgi:hypothetical protein
VCELVLSPAHVWSEANRLTRPFPEPAAKTEDGRVLTPNTAKHLWTQGLSARLGFGEELLDIIDGRIDAYQVTNDPSGLACGRYVLVGKMSVRERSFVSGRPT